MLELLIRDYGEASVAFVKGKESIPKLSLFFLTIFLCGVLSGGRASLSETRAGDDFLKRYREYQAFVGAGYAAINKREYIEAINHYSKAIEVSPFVASHYCYRGLA